VSFWGERTIAVSKEAREFLHTAFGVDHDRIQVVHNGIDGDHFRPPTPAESAAARTRLNLRSGVPIVGMLARMSPLKGHDVLLNSLSRLQKLGYNVHAALAGLSIEQDTTWRDQLVGMAERLGLSEQVHFLGQKDARDVIWSSDMTVLPSRQEAFPLAVIESMMCGRVAIRTPGGGADAQVEDGVTGFVVPFNDPDALADRMQLLFDQSERRRSMERAARTKALAEFSASEMALATHRIYSEVVASKAQAGRVASGRTLTGGGTAV